MSRRQNFAQHCMRKRWGGERRPRVGRCTLQRLPPNNRCSRPPPTRENGAIWRLAYAARLRRRLSTKPMGRSLSYAISSYTSACGIFPSLCRWSALEEGCCMYDRRMWPYLEAANQAELLAYLGTSALAESYFAQDITWVITGVASNDYNGVLWARLTSAEDEPCIIGTSAPAARRCRVSARPTPSRGSSTRTVM